MFVNLDYEENLDFVYQWKDSLDDLIGTLTNQGDVTMTVKHVTNLNLVDQNGQNVLSQEDYDTVVMNLCMELVYFTTTEIMRDYGQNCTKLVSRAKNQCIGQGSSNMCSLYNQLVRNECANAAGKPGSGAFGINCNSKY